MKSFSLYATYGAVSLCFLVTPACKAETPVQKPTPAPTSNPQGGNRHSTGGNRSEEGHSLRFEPESVTVPLKFSSQTPDTTDLKIAIKTETGPAAPVVVPVQIQPTVGTIPAIKIPIVLQIQTEQPASSPGPSATPRPDCDDHIGGISSGDLLTLIVALAAYVAAVRLFLKERLGDLEGPSVNTTVKSVIDRKKELKDAIARLALADFLFVAAALFLCWRLFIPGRLRPTPWFIASLFAAAIVYLAYLHSREWIRHPYLKAFGKWLRTKWPW